MKYSRCIVREPCPEMVGGLTTAGLGKPDYQLAMEQHKAYISALEYCGCEVTVLAADPIHPDSVFVEDIALLAGNCAIITRPGAVSRRGEILGIKVFLEEYFSSIEEIIAPGTLEAGDVLEVDEHYFIGLSERTNVAGAKQLIEILGNNGKTGSTVPLDKFLHLKTGIAYLGNKNILVAGEFINHKEFQNFRQFEVSEDEEYAANSILINGKVLMPCGYPETFESLKAEGYEIIQLDTSEFRKLDGGLSCLSLRF